MDFKAFSEAELNTFSKEMIISLYLQIATSFQILIDQNKQIMEQNEAQKKQIENLQESVTILTNHRFGRKTEKTSEMIEGQYSFSTNGEILLNEAEAINDQQPEEEKSDEELLEELKARREARKRKKNVRDIDLAFAEVERKDYDLTEEQLKELFPDGYVELGETVTSTVEFTPAKVIVHEEHIHKYKSKTSDTFVTADHPDHLLSHSILTPSLFAKIFTDKYINAIPINRISREFGWMDIVIRPQTIARWTIKITDKYLNQLVDRMEYWMKKKAKLIHADETPFVCEADRKKPGKTKNSKSYMWVFHTASCYGSPPIFLYVYKDNRRTENVEEFLKGYKGILMADGYEPYHTVARKSNGDIIVAGCWAHYLRSIIIPGELSVSA